MEKIDLRIELTPPDAEMNSWIASSDGAVKADGIGLTKEKALERLFGTLAIYYRAQTK